jgi:hypothetical protein
MNRFIVIQHWGNEDSFLNYRVKNKGEIISIWIKILKKLIYGNFKIVDSMPLFNNETTIISIDNDNSRIFMIDSHKGNHKKMVSISSPLSISLPQIDGIEINTIKVKVFNEDINEKKLILIEYVVNSLIKDGQIMPIDYAISEGTKSYDADIQAFSDTDDSFLYTFITNMLSFEEGYIRYDFDTKNSSEKIYMNEPQKKYLHPTYHLDIFLHTYSTFKVGLSDKINVVDFQNILSPNVNCHFLNKK